MKNQLIKVVQCVIVVLIMGFILSFTLRPKENHSPKTATATEKGFVVLELFTSQGCSSCPPADAILNTIAMENNPNIIPLAFHVDYWNYIGWKDPFSKVEFTNRQRSYAALLHSDQIYTPQLVINGKEQLVGSRGNEINKAILKEVIKPNKVNITIEKVSVINQKLKVDCSLIALQTKTVLHVALVKKEETTYIKRGENQGLKQTSHNVVFDFLTKPILSDKNITVDFKIDAIFDKAAYKIVAYTQNIETGVISSATQKEINLK